MDNTLGCSATDTRYRNMSDNELIREYPATELECELQGRLLDALASEDELRRQLTEIDELYE